MGKKNRWIWMPHPGHFICARDCRFHLNTYVGKYIVSTVGELWSDSRVRAIHASVKGIEIVGKGDAWDADYMEKIGYEKIGCDRLYETMVFKAVRTKNSCCPYAQASGADLDFQGYNTPEEAFSGHMKMCDKWSKKETRKS